MDNISFTDYDLDFGDLGGTVMWDKPLDESKVPISTSLGCCEKKHPGSRKMKHVFFLLGGS